MPRLVAASATASRAPLEKSSGVDSALPTTTVPSLSKATQSVNVPPISTPTTYSINSQLSDQKIMQIVQTFNASKPAVASARLTNDAWKCFDRAQHERA